MASAGDIPALARVWHVAREVDVSIGTMEGRKPPLVWRMEKEI